MSEIVSTFWDNMRGEHAIEYVIDLPGFHDSMTLMANEAYSFVLSQENYACRNKKVEIRPHDFSTWPFPGQKKPEIEREFQNACSWLYVHCRSDSSIYNNNFPFIYFNTQKLAAGDLKRNIGGKADYGGHFAKCCHKAAWWLHEILHILLHWNTIIIRRMSGEAFSVKSLGEEGRRMEQAAWDGAKQLFRLMDVGSHGYVGTKHDLCEAVVEDIFEHYERIDTRVIPPYHLGGAPVP